jgi:AraC-like DNA-binding protein
VNSANPATDDVLSDVLRAVRLRGAVFFSVTASSPWVAEAPAACELAPHVMPGAEHVIEYHVVVSGECWAGLPGGRAVRLKPGDIVVFPQGDAHVLASDLGARGPADPAEYADFAKQPLPIRVRYGTSGRDPVELVCGFLACDARPFNPLLTALPRVLHVAHGADETASQRMNQFMGAALAEARAPRPGGAVVLARLSELLFLEVVCQYVKTLAPEHRGWLAGLRDPLVGRALAALHAEPRREWTLELLARTVGSSRSVLAERFTDYVEVPPMQYLTQWRMQLAAALLGGPKTLAEIAAEVGYGSEAALSRAFKKTVGVAPAIWRESRADGASARALR